MKSFRGLLYLVVFLTTFRAPVMAQPIGRLYVVAIDISASRSPQAKAAEEVFLRRTLERLTFGDQIALVQVLQTGIDRQAGRWFYTIPPPADESYITKRDEEKMKGYIRGIEALLPSFFADKYDGKVLHTDLFTTFSVVAQLIRDANGRAVTLIVLSDMLQSTGEVEMDKARKMPSRGFLAEEAREGTLPNLGNACVLVVGADDTTPSGARVRDFWQKYFQAAGANLTSQDYRIFPPDSGLGSCH